MRDASSVDARASSPYDLGMRTTLTLDPDLAAALKARAKKTGAAWKDVVNDAIRAGLRAQPEARRQPYRTPVHDGGEPALQGVHSVHDMLVFAEGEDFK